MYLFFAIILILFITFMVICYFCYAYAFRKDHKRQSSEYEVPRSPYREQALKNINALLEEPFEWVEITSKDKLKLKAHYYHFKDGAPVAIMMHGYRSNYCRDGNGGFKIAKEYGLNILMPDQRAHGKSEGQAITFGIKERYDCLEWVNYITNRFGKDTKIVLIGLSMGAATVMMASDIVPTQNVKGIIADCGFSSPKEILMKVSGEMKIPPRLAYFMLKTGALVYGGFNPDEASPVKSLAKTSLPVLFIHGEADTFVPCTMSHKCHEACVSPKEIFIVSKATHGMSYYLDTEGYTKTAIAFLDKILK